MANQMAKMAIVLEEHHARQCHRSQEPIWQPLRPSQVRTGVRGKGRSIRMAILALTCARGERLTAQYDVFSHPSSSTAEGIPYVVVIQSDPQVPWPRD
jgi:hypothetical protein